MAQPQWFPMYPTDFLTSTAMMSPVQGWAYTQLLLYAWTNAAVPDDRETCSRMTRCDLSDGDWAVIRARFTPTPAGLVHRRLEKERADALRRSEQAADSGRRGAAARWGRHSDPIGDPIGNPNGNPNGKTMAATSTTTYTPHPSGGGAGGGEGVVSAKQGTKQPAVSSVAARRSPVARPNASDGSTPHPTPSDATGGISADVALRDPTPAEMDRITRWPGSRTVPPVALEGKRRVLVRMLREKKVSAEYLAPAWEAALREWGERGTDPYDFVANTLLGEWEGVRFPDAVMKHRLGMGAA